MKPADEIWDRRASAFVELGGAFCFSFQAVELARQVEKYRVLDSKIATRMGFKWWLDVR